MTVPRGLRFAAAVAVASLSLGLFAATHSELAGGARAHDSSGCAPETNTCSQQTLPCPGCSVSAGPVTNVGANQAVYIDVTGAPLGDELEIALCSLVGGTQVVAQPQCASEIPGSTITNSPYQYEYGTVTTNQTILSIPTEYDPNIAGATPITSQTADQLFVDGDVTSSFFCDDSSNPCAVEVMDIPEADTADVLGPGVPPNPKYSAVGHTAIFPLNFNQGGSGCGSAPIMQVDASYSVAQFLPEAGLATCNEPGGVAGIATDLASTDDAGCAAGSGTTCPINDVISGTVPVTFTDDPEDPATFAEEKAAGGTFAYIPIALSGTEIAFSGQAAYSFQGSVVTFPLHSYELTPAQAAGIMSQLWNSPTAGLGVPNDAICGQLSGKAQCKETRTTGSSGPLLVETAGGKTGNLEVSTATSLTPKTKTFEDYSYLGNYSNGQGQTVGGEKVFYGDTGYALLNPWPYSFAGNTVFESNLGAMWPSTSSGATYESTQWMCAAPNTSYTVSLPFGGTASVQDPMSAQQIVADVEQDPVPAQNNKNGLTPGVVDQSVLSPASDCQALSELPINFNNSEAAQNGRYDPSSQPITAAHAMQGAIPKYGGNGGFAFTAMDTSEADFFGLLPASLQNAAGSFVSPSSDSLEAAVKDATMNADGTITPDWNDTGDSAAYPLPMVTYALVSTAPQPTATQATQLKDLLTNLVTYSNEGGSSTFPLPPGYAPLPTSLYNAALTDISNDIVGPSGSSGGSGGSGGSSGSSAGSAASGASANVAPGHLAGAAVGGGGRGGGGGGAARGTTGSSTGGAAGAASPGISSPGAFARHLITVTVGDNRFFIPTLLLLALLCLIGGPLLYLSPSLRKREVGDHGGADRPDVAAGGPGPPETG